MNEHNAAPTARAVPGATHNPKFPTVANPSSPRTGRRPNVVFRQIVGSLTAAVVVSGLCTASVGAEPIPGTRAHFAGGPPATAAIFNATAPALIAPAAPVIVKTAPSGRYVTTTSLRLRSSASTKARIIRVLPRGYTVTVIGSKGAWRKVTAGGRTGWVHGNYISKPGAKPKSVAVKASSGTYATTTSLRLRTSPSTRAGILTTLPRGYKLTVIGSSGAWRKVKAGGRTGWVHGNYIRKVGATSKPAATTTKAVTRASGTYWTTTSLRLRSSASTSSRILTTLGSGTRVTVIGKNGVWRKVTVGGRTGWVHSGYLRGSSPKPKAKPRETKAAVFAKVRSIINPLGGSDVRLVYGDNCGGHEACAWKGVIYIVPGTMSSISARKFKWMMVHELAHTFQLKLGLSRLEKSHAPKTFRWNGYPWIEVLANCMAASKGVPNVMNCPANQVKMAAKIWSGKMPY